jgi:Virulence protein RhuM family
MPKHIPHAELQEIESIVAAHPEGIGVQRIRRELGRKVPQRTLQYRLKYLVDTQRLERQGERRWATYRKKPTVYPARNMRIGGVREDNGDYRSDPLAANGEVLVYEAPDGEARVEVRLERETVWLTQQQMAELFGRDRSVVAKHLRNAFDEGELDPDSTCAKFAQVRPEGARTVSRQVDHYNLDVIISVGYRVKSLRGTQFRIWATRTLRDHLVRGYTLNERRLAERGLDEARASLDLLARTR